MSGLIRRLFGGRAVGPAVPTPVPLAFAMDTDDDGRHVVRLTMGLPNGLEPVTDPAALGRYGFALEHDGRRFTPRVQDLEVLAALRSLDPETLPDGALVFDVSPPVLAYLRDRPDVTEGDGSRRLEIVAEPLQPTMRVDYSPESGATVVAGYVTSDGVIQDAEALPRTPDGGYVRDGDRFVPIAEPTAALKPWLARGETHVPMRDVPEFFARHLGALRATTDQRLSPAALAVRVIDEAGPPRITLDARTRGWLDFEVRFGTTDADVSLMDAAAAVERGDTHLQVGTDTFVRIDPTAVAAAERSVQAAGVEATSTGFRLPKQQIGTLQDLVKGLGGSTEVTAAYQSFLDDLAGLELDVNYRLPEAIEATLTGRGFTPRPYQRQGIHWLSWLAEQGLHGLLADDMGLGKTAQTALAIRADYERYPDSPPHSLVVCPNSVIEGWAREVAWVFPAITIDRHLGTRRDLDDFRETGPRLFISSYATMARDIERLRDVVFRYVVLDEASHIKNPAAQRTRAMKGLTALHRLCLTGTPVENRPAELWSLMDFLLPGHLGDHGRFVRTVEQPILDGDETVAAELAARVGPFLLRRLKEDVAPDLPEKVELRAWCGLTAEQAALYQRVLGGFNPTTDALARGEQVSFPTGILPILTRLQQVCDHPALLEEPGVGTPMVIEGRSEKFDLALERIEDVAELGEKVIVFSHYLGMLDLLGTALDARGIRFVRIDGGTKDRQGLVDRLGREDDLTVALCSLQATGYGINLQTANHVIHVDRWWNPALEDQATARAHRIGQNRTVFVHRLLVRGTLEERIDALLERKRGIADTIVGGAIVGDTVWTREELLAILRPFDPKELPVDGAGVASHDVSAG